MVDKSPARFEQEVRPHFGAISCVHGTAIQALRNKHKLLTNACPYFVEIVKLLEWIILSETAVAKVAPTHRRRSCPLRCLQIRDNERVKRCNAHCASPGDLPELNDPNPGAVEAISNFLFFVELRTLISI